MTGISVQNIWARTYITKAFLRFLDQEKLAVDQLIAAEIDLYMRKLQEEDVEIVIFNDKVAEIHCFFRFLTARGYYSKVPCIYGALDYGLMKYVPTKSNP